MIWKASTALLVLLLVAAVVPLRRHFAEVPPPPPPALRGALGVPDGVTLGTGTDPLDAAIAPDERSVVFVATRNGVVQLWRHVFADDRATPLPGTLGASFPAWSPDGRTIAFFAGGELRTIGPDGSGGSSLAMAPNPGGVTYLADGAILFVPEARGPIKRLAGGQVSDATRLSGDDIGHAFPRPGPGGTFIYVATTRKGRRVIRQVAPDGEHELTTTGGHGEMQGDVLLHVRDTVLLAQRVDPERHVLVGRSTVLATGAGAGEMPHAYLASSPRLVLWASAPTANRVLAWIDRTGRVLATPSEPGDYWQVRLSPDERRAAVTALDPQLRTLDVYVVPLDNATMARRVSLALGPDTDPIWSPDGTRLVYRSVQNSIASIYARALDPLTAPEQEIIKTGADLSPWDWQGNTLFYSVAAPGTARMDLWMGDLRTNRTTQLTKSGFTASDAHLSPDGAWLTYVSEESGQQEVYVEPWPKRAPRVRVSFGGGRRPQWAYDSQTVYFLRGNAVMQSGQIGTTAVPAFSTPAALFEVPGLRDIAVTRSGSRMLAVIGPPAGTTTSAHLVVDWAGLVPPAPTPKR